MSTVSRKDPFLISTLVIGALLISSFASMALIPNTVIQSTERVVSKDNVILQTASATSEGGGETGGGETGGGETGGGETGGGETGGGETGGGETGGGETGGGETGGGETGGGDLSQGNGLLTPTPAPTQGFEGFPLTLTPTPQPTQGFEGFPLTPTPRTNGFPLTPAPGSEGLPTPRIYSSSYRYPRLVRTYSTHSNCTPTPDLASPTPTPDLATPTPTPDLASPTPTPTSRHLFRRNCAIGEARVGFLHAPICP